jgi:hypothetical protein
MTTKSLETGAKEMHLREPSGMWDGLEGSWSRGRATFGSTPPTVFISASVWIGISCGRRFIQIARYTCTVLEDNSGVLDNAPTEAQRASRKGKDERE